MSLNPVLWSGWTSRKTCNKQNLRFYEFFAAYHNKLCKTQLENNSLNQHDKQQPGLAHASQNKNNANFNLSYALDRRSSYAAC